MVGTDVRIRSSESVGGHILAATVGTLRLHSTLSAVAAGIRHRHRTLTAGRTHPGSDTDSA